jgi:hypothetical protein
MFHWLRGRVLDYFPSRSRDPRRLRRRCPALEVLEDKNAPDNLLPIALPDLFTFDEDETLEIAAPGVLDNDYDLDNDPLTAVLLDGPESGELTFNADGSFIYTPEQDFHGQVTFTYRVFDGTDYSEIALVTLVIQPVNDAPMAVGDYAATDWNIPITISVLENDFDVDGDVLTVTSVSAPSNGTATLNPDNTVTYAPNTNWYGTDSFSYTISDGLGGTDYATAAITVVPPESYPVAMEDDVITDEDTAINIAVLDNDEPGESETLEVIAVTQGEHGTVAMETDETVTYTPAANWHGLDTFTYTMQNDDDLTHTAEVWVLVEPVNDLPQALDDTDLETAEDQPLTFDPVLNDNDIDGDPLSIIDVTQPEHGALKFNDDGTITYTPDSDWNGTDEFSYTLWDGFDGGEDTGTVSITVYPVADAPIAYNDLFLGYWSPSQPYIEPPAGLLANDIDYDYRDGDYDFESLQVVPFTAEIDGGTLVVNSDGSFSYEAAGPRHIVFEYTVTDGSLTGNTATAHLFTYIFGQEPWNTQNPPPPQPVTVDDQLYFAHNTVTGNVMLNDSNVAYEVLRTPPQRGRMTYFNYDGTFEYVPPANDIGAVDGVRRTADNWEDTGWMEYNGYTADGLAANAGWASALKLDGVKADLDIGGMDEDEEDKVGGSVVMPIYDSIYGWNNPNSDGRPAKYTPRKQIVLMPATPAGWNGNLVLTRSWAWIPGLPNGLPHLNVYGQSSGGQPLLFDGTDNKFSNGAIPAGGLVLYVEGGSSSNQMRDAWL